MTDGRPKRTWSTESPLGPFRGSRRAELLERASAVLRERYGDWAVAELEQGVERLDVAAAAEQLLGAEEEPRASEPVATPAAPTIDEGLFRAQRFLEVMRRQSSARGGRSPKQVAREVLWGLDD